MCARGAGSPALPAIVQGNRPFRAKSLCGSRYRATSFPLQKSRNILTDMNASKDTRWHQRFENLECAFRLLQDAAGRQSLADLEAEGMVHRFEYTFELAWKTLKDFLELQGFSVAYPREVIKTAFQVGLISMGDAWFEMLDRRNEAAIVRWNARWFSDPGLWAPSRQGLM